MGRGNKRKNARKSQREDPKKAHIRSMKSHESDERKLIMVRNLKLKQLKEHVLTQSERMQNYIPDEIRDAILEKWLTYANSDCLN